MTELQKGLQINNHYILEEYKGSGSYGEVWLARDIFSDMKVALKVYISLDTRGLDEFKEEYRVAYGLSHENLLTTSYFDVWEQRPFLVMKYCSNGSAANLAGKISDETVIWRFIRDVAAGLACLHNLEPDPIIHQDIKPDNILIDEQGRFIITDFGISKKVRSTMRRQSNRAIKAGAVAYMGPERFVKDPVLIKASDIWSLGASIYELATGELPFCGMGGGMLLNNAELPELDQKRWSTDLNKTMRACLAKETWDRPMAQHLVQIANKKLNGESIEDDKPVKKKISFVTKFWGGIAVLFVIVFLISVYTTDPLEKEAKSKWPEYEEMVETCKDRMYHCSGESVQCLLDAKEILASIKLMEDKYAAVMPKFNSYNDLYPALNGQLEDASLAWVKAAESQYSKAKNVAKAIEYYQVALSLKGNDAKVRDAYRAMLEKGGYIRIKDMQFRNEDIKDKVIDDYGAKLHASTLKYLCLRIIYDGLSDETKSINLDCKIYNSKGQLEKGQNSSEYYTYSVKNFKVASGSDLSAALLGWGNDSSSTYTPGDYRVEVWFNGYEIFSKGITLY